MKTSEAFIDEDGCGDVETEGPEHDTDAETDNGKVFRALGKGPCVLCGRSIQNQLAYWSQEPCGAYHVDCQNVNQESSAQDRAPVSLAETTPKVPAGHDEPVTPVVLRQPEETPSIPQAKGIEQRGLAPADRAEEYLNARMYETPEGLQLRTHRGQWLRYTGKYYEGLKQERLEDDILNYFNSTGYGARSPRLSYPRWSSS